MNKFFYSALAAGSLLALSACSAEEPRIANNDGNVSITISLPEQLATRFAEAQSVDKLYYSVFDTDNGYVTSKELEWTKGQLTQNVEIQLVSNETYRIVFFAYAADAVTIGAEATETGYAFDPQTAALSVNYNNIAANNDIYDAFYTMDEFTVTGQPIEEVLYRPFGQLNIGTNDEDTDVVQAYGLDKYNCVLSMSSKNLASGLNLLTGVYTPAAANETYTFEVSKINEIDNNLNPFPEVNAPGTFSYLDMNFFLVMPTKNVTEDDATLVDATFLITGKNNKEVNNLGLSNIPMRANYRTNVYGALLTTLQQFNVTIDPAFEKPDYIYTLWDGTVVKPTITNGKAVINSPAELAGLQQLIAEGNNLEGVTVTLNADMDLQGKNWTPIADPETEVVEPMGPATFDGPTFAGTFDGNGKTIKNLTLPAATDAKSVVGLFGAVKGTIKNLTVENVNINEKLNVLCAGGVVGLLHDGGAVENVTVKSGKIHSYRGVGGVVGRMLVDCTVTGCENGADVNGTYDTGGVVGLASGNKSASVMNNIENCKNTGNITATGYAAGIVGTNEGNVKNCVNTGNVTTSNASTGGIVGEIRCAGEIIDNINTGTVTGGADGVGGIVGWIRYLNQSNECSYFASVVVKDNKNWGDVLGGNHNGGIVGDIYNLANVEGNYSYAKRIEAKAYAGAIVGKIYWSTPYPFGDTTADNFVNVIGNYSSTTMEQLFPIPSDEIYWAGFYGGAEQKITVTMRDNELVDYVAPPAL